MQAETITSVLKANTEKPGEATSRDTTSSVAAATPRVLDPQGPLAGTVGEGPTLAEFFVNVYAPLRLVGRSVDSRIQYECAIRVFGKYAGRAVHVADLGDELLAGHLSWIIARGGTIPTANKARSHLSAIWRLAYRKKLVGVLPDVPKLREPKIRPSAWTLEEFGRLLEAAEQTPGEIEGIQAGLWWRGLLSVLYFTGLRISATMLIETDHLTLSGSETWLFVPAEHQKHRSDQRFKLPGEVAELLQEIIGERTGRVFLWPYRREALGIAFKKILQRAGLSDGRKDMFHKIRRLSATQIAVKLGRSAACDHLGHSALSVTERYLDLTQIPTIRAADVLPPLPMRGIIGNRSAE